MEIKEEKLEKVAGGASADENFGQKCPKCGSDDVYLYYEHDEIGVFRCRACGNQWSVGE